MFDFKHPFFKPLLTRIATATICLGWGVYEFSTGAPFWGCLFAGVGIVASYNFFFVSDRPNDK